MSDLMLSFDTDIADRARADLRLASPEWISLPVAQKMARLAPYVRAQALRDEQRKAA